MNNPRWTSLCLTLFLLLETIFDVYFCCSSYKDKKQKQTTFDFIYFFTASFYLFSSSKYTIFFQEFNPDYFL